MTIRRVGLGLGFVCLASAACAIPSGSAENTASSGAALSAAQSGLVVSECQSGSNGFLELYNGGSATIDLANDAACWFVDDTNGGGSPKRVNDTNTNHAATSTTCAAAGRAATCALLAPGEHVWVPYAFVNSTTADECRLLSSAKSGATCSTTYVDEGVGGATASTAAGQCFGRQPSGGAWQSAAIACTKGAPNGGGGPSCTVGAACDDSDACTTGETYSATCTCGGGSALGCDDGNPCTADSCASASGCAHAPVADGTACGGTSTCQAGVCTAPSAGTDAVIVRQARADRLLLQGMIVTPDVAFAGEVLVEGDTLTCVAASCANMPAAVDATIVQTNGIIAPGLIDTHNHILFDIFDETDWSPSKSYTNHNQWTAEPKYKALVDTKQYLNGEGSSVDFGCEMLKYGELKALVSGTTSVVGAANPANRSCYGSLVRTIDQSANDLPDDTMQVATLFPSTSTADSVCANFSSGATTAYLIHVAEGVDATARNEFAKLLTIPTVDGCLHAPQTAIVHGTALGDPEFSTMAQSGMSLVWSPRSNVFLYGAGTDLTKTTNVPLARSKGINVSLAPDWSIGGSQNLLDELRFAHQVDAAQWGNSLDAQTLTRMVTTNPARAMHLDGVLGSLTVGKKADVVVYGGDAAHPFDALLAATPKDVRLVLVGGTALYGDAQLKPVGPASPGCEDLAICTKNKFVCVAENGGTASNKLGQTYAQIESTLSSALASYDALGLTQWTFSPIAPLVKCE